jgi:hypothetical protein
LKLKNEDDYYAVVTGRFQRRSRNHEKLVREAAEYFTNLGFELVTPHPIDLLLKSTIPVIFEAKPIGSRNALFAVREAVGQLFEYRHFRGPTDAYLCILLDADPGDALVTYVEVFLQLGICWVSGEVFEAGPRTLVELSARQAPLYQSTATS